MRNHEARNLPPSELGPSDVEKAFKKRMRDDAELLRTQDMPVRIKRAGGEIVIGKITDIHNDDDTVTIAWYDEKARKQTQETVDMERMHSWQTGSEASSDRRLAMARSEWARTQNDSMELKDSDLEEIEDLTADAKLEAPEVEDMSAHAEMITEKPPAIDDMSAHAEMTDDPSKMNKAEEMAVDAVLGDGSLDVDTSKLEADLAKTKSKKEFDAMLKQRIKEGGPQRKKSMEDLRPPKFTGGSEALRERPMPMERTKSPQEYLAGQVSETLKHGMVMDWVDDAQNYEIYIPAVDSLEREARGGRQAVIYTSNNPEIAKKIWAAAEEAAKTTTDPTEIHDKIAEARERIVNEEAKSEWDNYIYNKDRSAWEEVRTVTQSDVRDQIAAQALLAKIESADDPTDKKKAYVAEQTGIAEARAKLESAAKEYAERSKLKDEYVPSTPSKPMEYETPKLKSIERKLWREHGVNVEAIPTRGFFAKLGSGIKGILNSDYRNTMKAYREALDEARFGEAPTSITEGPQAPGTGTLTGEQENAWFEQGDNLAAQAKADAKASAKEMAEYADRAERGVGAREKNRKMLSHEAKQYRDIGRKMTANEAGVQARKNAEVLGMVEKELKDDFGIDIINMPVAGIWHNADLKVRMSSDKKLRAKMEQYVDLRKVAEARMEEVGPGFDKVTSDPAQEAKASAKNSEYQKMMREEQAETEREVIAEARGKGGAIELTANAETRAKLERKLKEYEGRNPYQAPEANWHETYKREILGSLLEDGAMDAKKLRTKFKKKYNTLDAKAFDSAFGIITEYNDDSREGITGGTGLK